jgi:hypothetical protein
MRLPKGVTKKAVRAALGKHVPMYRWLLNCNLDGYREYIYQGISRSASLESRGSLLAYEVKLWELTGVEEDALSWVTYLDVEGQGLVTNLEDAQYLAAAWVNVEREEGA